MDGHFCGAPGSAEVDASTEPDSDAAGGPVDGSIDAAIMHLEYTATIAECLDPTLPDPDQCKAVNGAAQLVIDTSDSQTLNPWQAYLRFELDDAIAGKRVVAVTLVAVATDNVKAPGPDTGSIWRVEQFTASSLFNTTPVQLDSQPLAGSQGPVVKLQPINWPLPIDLVAPNSAVFLGLLPNNSDGVNYSNLAGPSPPRLIIDVQ